MTSVYKTVVLLQEGHPSCKKASVGMLVMVMWLELCMSYNYNYHHKFIRSRMDFHARTGLQKLSWNNGH